MKKELAPIIDSSQRGLDIANSGLVNKPVAALALSIMRDRADAEYRTRTGGGAPAGGAGIPQLFQAAGNLAFGQPARAQKNTTTTLVIQSPPGASPTVIPSP